MLLSEVLANTLPNLLKSGNFMLNHEIDVRVLGIEAEFAVTPIITIKYGVVTKRVEVEDEGLRDTFDDIQDMSMFNMTPYVEDLFDDMVNA